MDPSTYIKDYINALENGKGYEYISKHGCDFHILTLIDIIKELDYAISHSHDIEDIYINAATELKDIYDCWEE